MDGFLLVLHLLGLAINQREMPLNWVTLTTLAIGRCIRFVLSTRQDQSIQDISLLHIHTDNRNILNVGDSSERRLRWISYVDEYGPILHYVEGPFNVIADTLSRLSRNNRYQ